jgi:cellulose synthase/poly-beta-1,6-N-acetylglucosamine synthase-like glycosyltransferase
MVTTLQPMALLAIESLTGQLTRRFFDDTFAGIHQLDWFDLSLLIPYFVCLGILAVYGSHRYLTIVRYRRHRNKLEAPPAKLYAKLPRVTIQLPLYNERYVVERLLESVARIRYPRELLQIQVLDDSTDETHAITERLVGEYRAGGVPVEYHHRTNRTGFKAGALEDGLRSAIGELVAIFDADFVPAEDFLEKTVHYFTDPEIGMVQTRWTYLNRGYSLLTEVQAMMLDGHFVLEHTARCGSGLFFNFNGTAGVLRRQMIEDAGGWQHDTLTEDSDLSYRAQLRGWKFRYLPHVESPSELPIETYAFQVQQARWAKGLTQVALKLLPAILRAPISRREKVEAFFHLTPNVSYPLMVAVSALMLPVMVVRFYMGWLEMLVLDLPVILATFFSIIVFYAAAQHGRDPLGWKRSLALMPMLIAAGIGLTIVNTRAVLEALFRIPTAFARTAKYAISGGRKPVRAASRSYGRESGLLPYVEVALGTVFLAMVYFAVDSMNLMAVPFLLMFVGGYYWVGLGTLYEEHRGRLRWERERQVAAEAEASK